MIERYCTKEGCPGGVGCTNKWRVSGDSCAMEYVASSLPKELRWAGEGIPPRSWMVGNVKVYRSYSDACD